jgi:hypothetical protein
MAFYRFQIDASIPAATVVDRLRTAVGPMRPFGRNRPAGFFATRPFGADPGEKPEPPFVGAVQNESFRIQRNIAHRNSFLPLLDGRISPTPSGARINVTMSMQPLVFVFILCWLAMVGHGALTDRSTNHALLWGMFVFGILLALVGFFPEVDRAKTLLSTVILSPQNTAWQLSLD